MNKPNDKAKAHFLMQYYEQRVLYINDFHENPFPVMDEYVRHVFSAGEKCYVELRTVDMLTDGEKKIVGKLAGLTGNLRVLKDGSVKGKSRDKVEFYKEIEDCCYWNGDMYDGSYSSELPNVCYDYLRSIGILLPITILIDNKPVTMSVSEILAAGWAKVKEV